MTTQELFTLISNLSKRARRNILEYARVLVSSQERGLPAPTAEEWAGLKPEARRKILALVIGDSSDHRP